MALQAPNGRPPRAAVLFVEEEQGASHQSADSEDLVGTAEGDDVEKTQSPVDQNDGQGLLPEPWFPQLGLHESPHWCISRGRRDEGNYKDFTALGEAVNLAARLAQAARSGEVLVTESTRNAARLADGEKRSIDAKGFPQPIDVTALRYQD